MLNQSNFFLIIEVYKPEDIYLQYKMYTVYIVCIYIEAWRGADDKGSHNRL